MPQFEEIYGLISSDLHSLNKLWEVGENDMGRRIFSIYVFSLFGISSRLFVDFVNDSIPPEGNDLISAADIAAAKSDNARDQKAIPHLLFSIRYCSRFFGVRDFKAKSLPGWTDLDKARTIRDRIAHPRHISDLHVSLEENTTNKAALIWLINALEYLKMCANHPGVSARAIIEMMSRE
jgi:hypothetical protein